ncbi:hypothetical protein DER46DRAFT_621100 [Fusarium sp. MPI-SDFR-AT-0072]|nr:hypothetical protein DER46DRAFT_621100 [Fusarium sp. MPI-SDFR-AT-0072]
MLKSSFAGHGASDASLVPDLGAYWRTVSTTSENAGGMAYAIGPNYSTPWIRYDQADFRATVSKAQAALALARAVKAMRCVFDNFSEDIDDLDTGKPTGPETLEAMHILEAGLPSQDGLDYPAFCHFYIYIIEMAPNPEKSIIIVDQLRQIVPDGSHMQHMATHIDIACAYRTHNIHVFVYATMMTGRSRDAIQASKRITRDKDLFYILNAIIYYAISEVARKEIKAAFRAVPENGQHGITYKAETALQGNFNQAFAYLSNEVRLEDRLPYADPPGYKYLAHSGQSKEVKRIYLQQDIAVASANILLRASCFSRLLTAKCYNGCSL